MERPYKRIWGIAYKNVLKGDNPTKHVTASQKDRDALYNDPAIRLSEGDLERFKSLKGKPICREHDRSVVLGHIHGYDVDPVDGHLRVMARIFTDTEEGRQAAEQLERGELNGLSVGYTTSMYQGTTKVASKSFDELTLTEEPFFEGCQVTVQASKKKNLASKESTYNTEVLWINLSKENPMSDSTAPTPAPERQAPQPTSEAQGPQHHVAHKEASSLLKVADGLQEQVDVAKASADKERVSAEEIRKQLEQQNRELEQLRAYKAADEAAYAKAKAAEAQETLKIHEEMRGQTFPPDVQRAMIETMCSKNPTDLQKTEILCSQASAYLSQKNARIKAEEDNKALLEQLAKQKEENELVQERITASRQSVRGLYDVRSSDIQPARGDEAEGVQYEVNASRSGGDAFDSFFPNRGAQSDTVVVPQASPVELNLPFFKKTPAATVQVTASRNGAGAPVLTMRAAPVHDKVDHLHYSMRNARNAHWFSMMVSQADAMMAGPDAVLRPDREDGARKVPDFSKDSLE